MLARYVKSLTNNSALYNLYIILRHKHKDRHWSVQVKKKTATGKALEHFDDFYKTVYNKSWPSIRQGLLADHKYVAIINNYSDNEKTITNLENTGALNMRTQFNLEKEYLIERQNSRRRDKLLDEIKKLDEKLETQSNQFITEQLVDNKETNLNREHFSMEEEKTKVRATNSVAESLKYAEYDMSRIISPSTNDISSALYEYVPATKLKGKENWIPETQHYRYYEGTNSFHVNVEKEYDLPFPEHLNVYCYEQSNHCAFESPKKGVTDVLDYYLLDGGSVLPVLALGIKPGDTVLDMCSAPGGKTLIALQTLYPETIVCNDIDYSRVKRIYNVLRQYLYDLDERWLKSGRVKVLQEDARGISMEGFDCILVDVPCTNDRLSVKENDNNWFKPSRTKERLQLPETQAAILSNALKLVKVGGTVVYSTCSLSPIQNDGVVNMALKQLWEDTSIQITVKDLTPALEATKCIFKFVEPNVLKYGHLVVPYLPQNYGPMYFCKLVRTS